MGRMRIIRVSRAFAFSFERADHLIIGIVLDVEVDGVLVVIRFVKHLLAETLIHVLRSLRFKSVEHLSGASPHQILAQIGAAFCAFGIEGFRRKQIICIVNRLRADERLNLRAVRR